MFAPTSVSALLDLGSDSREIDREMAVREEGPCPGGLSIRRRVRNAYYITGTNGNDDRNSWR